MIEAELKARVPAPHDIQARLDERAEGRTETYRDTYYDTQDHTLDAQGRELRVRTVHSDTGTRTVLTYKDAVVDEDSGSKPEYETQVADPEAVHALLRGLGYVPLIAFEKHCRNYTFEAHGRPVLATLVRVPELDGTFIEVETPAEETDLTPALDTVRTVLAELGIQPADITRELYTDAVRTQRTTTPAT
ncbi:class IV adenylate cyclase [Streptomyces sp. NPDC058953]|uniref:class IV adenylate cyclase n=1 Tax=unclassified Streptomyces TaxID=2593676 RepID=UPI0036BC0763